MTSEDVRIRLRDILDDVHTGAEIIIEAIETAVGCELRTMASWKAARKRN